MKGRSAVMALDPLNPNSVRDLDTFLAFATALAEDRRASAAAEKKNPSSPYGPAAFGWVNVTIEDFLESAVAWAESTRMGEGQGLPSGPSWRAFAVFLYCGKIYE
jgi:hypothetical protein